MSFKSEPILEFKGLNGHIYLFDNHLTIKRLFVHKLLRHDLSKEYTLPLSQISEIHLRRSSTLKKGYVRFIGVGKDASYLSFLGINTNDGTVTITKNNNDFVVRFIHRVHELNPSINVLDLDDSAVDSQGKYIINKVVGVAKSNLTSAGVKLNELKNSAANSDKFKEFKIIATKSELAKGTVILAACACERVVKKKYGLRYGGDISPILVGRILGDNYRKTGEEVAKNLQSTSDKAETPENRH